MKELPNIATVTESQVKFGIKLGLDLKCNTVGVAVVKIQDAIDIAFWGLALGCPTAKQIELAARFGYNISTCSRRVGDAVINDLMEQLNHDTIESEKLAAGVKVTNIHDPIETQYTISSIYPDGTVYFRGGNGKRAWARSLRRVRNRRCHPPS